MKQPPPFDECLDQALKDYEKDLWSRSDPKKKRGKQTISHRVRGATEFARFLVGKPSLKNERITGRFSEIDPPKASGVRLLKMDRKAPSPLPRFKNPFERTA
jgi:hypothetical protein